MRRRTILLLAALLAGCRDDAGSEPETATVAFAHRGGMMVDADEGAVGEAVGFEAAQASVTQAPVREPRMLIRNGRAGVEVEDIDDAVAALERKAVRVGGFVASVGKQAGEDRTRMATLTLRVPADRFDALVASLDSLGEVEDVYIDAEDVGEAYADLEVRVANARRLEQRLLDLLASRTGTLEDVLAVERELARIREQIETMDAQMRSLRNRVDMSTLTVSLYEPEPIFSSRPGGNVIARSVRQAGRNFVGFVAGFIASLGVLVPLAFLGVVLAWLWRIVRRRRRARSEEP